MENKIQEEIIEREVRQSLKKFHVGRDLEKISLDEVFNLASKLKRQELISLNLMKQINDGAELEFQLKLKEEKPVEYTKYLAQKNTSNSIQIFYVEGKTEQEFKLDYINKRISVRSKEDPYSEKALEIILRNKLKKRIISLKTSSYKFGLEESEFNKYLASLNIIQNNSIEIDHSKELEKLLMESFIDRSVHFVYYLCLRWDNARGETHINDSLKPFEFINKLGESEIRTGESKIFQLENTINFANQLKKYGLNDHTLIIADFDLSKYKDLGYSLDDKVDKYLNSCKDFLGGKINVMKQTYFFENLGALKSEYDVIFDSVYNNDGKFINQNYVFEEINVNRLKKKIYLNNWDDELCKFFTSSGIARNIFEGLAFEKQDKLFVPLIFSKNASIGKEFNSALKKKLPVICLPIYHDNLGGIKYA